MTEYSPAFPKVGPKKKTAKIMNRKARVHDIDQPKEKHCRRCGRKTDAERFAHYEGFRRSEFGKGTGQKCNDLMTAWLCQKCTDIMDHKPIDVTQFESNKRESAQVYRHNELLKIQHSEEWLYLICKTWLI